MSEVYPSAFPLRWPRAFHVEPFWLRPYRYEVRNAAGGLIAFLQNVVSATSTHTINSFNKLEITLPKSEGDYLSGANEVWVRDAKGDLVGKFQFQHKSERRSGGVAMAQVECRSYGAQLSREFMPAYSATPGQHKTIQTIVEEILAAQVHHRPITVGAIDAAIGDLERAVDFTRTTMLAALQSIEETLEAVTVFWVDDNRALQWRVVSASVDGLQLRIERNALEIEREVDATEQATRIYAYGKPNDEGDRLKLTDYPGQTEEYIQAPMASWQYRKQFIVNRNHVAVDVVNGVAGVQNFAVHIVLSADEDLAAYAKADGGDFRFLSERGSSLTFEVDSFDAETGALDVWVLIPSLSAIYDTPLYLYFGNSGAADASGTVDHATGGKSAAWVSTYNNNLAEADFVSIGPMASCPGVISKVISDERVIYPETLMAKAQRALLESKDERVSYTVAAIDLSETSAAADYARFTLGATVKVIDADMAINADEVVVELERDLSEPYRVNLQLAATKRSIYDLLTDIEREAREESLTELPETWPADAVDMGDGETMLDDLLYPETTDISGDHVRMPTEGGASSAALTAYNWPLSKVDLEVIEGEENLMADLWQYPYDNASAKEKYIDARMIKGLEDIFGTAASGKSFGQFGWLNEVE